jgi:RimJ/RimL family protein N-acetyltransferase
MESPPNEFRTARLRLRKPVLRDAAEIFERWAQDAEVTRYLVWTPHRDVTESEAHIARCEAGWSDGTSFVWMIEEHSEGALVGSIAARPGVHGVNLGYLIARQAWGRGLMVEALQPVVNWWLGQRDVFRVWATCDVDNAASVRVLEKAGFEFEGILRRWDYHPNIGPGRRDARCYGLVRA